MRSFRFIVSAVALVAAPSIELPPLAPAGRTVVVHGGVDDWWIEGLPPRTVAQGPGETLLLAFDEVETRKLFAESYLGPIHRDGVQLVLLLEPHQGSGHPRCYPGGPFGSCTCVTECGPAVLCGNRIGDDGWYYPATPAVVRTERKALLPMNVSLACWGEEMVQTYCVACHSEGEADRPAPSFRQPLRLGSERVLSDGRRVTVDQDYIRRAILQPQADRVTGYDEINMPPFRFSEGQVLALTAFLMETPKQRQLRDCRPRY